VPNQPGFKVPSKAAPKGQAWRRWPTRYEIPRLYSITPHRFAAAVNRAHVPSYKCPDNTIRFKPDELNAVFGRPGAPRSDPPVRAGRNSGPARARARKRDDDDDDDDDDSEPVRVDPPVNTVHDLFKEVIAMLRELRTEKVDALKYALDPLKEGISLLKELLAASMKRASELEASATAVATEREALMSAVHVRNLEIKRFESSEQRRAQVMEIVKAYAPELVATYVASAAVPKNAIDFLGSLDVDMLRAMQTELELTAAQKSQLGSVIDLLAKQQQRPSAAKQESKANGSA
jgi:hypothetical protein